MQYALSEPAEPVLGAGHLGCHLKMADPRYKLEYAAREHMFCGAQYLMAATEKAGGVRAHGRNILSAGPLSQFWARAPGVHL